jgi:acetyl esterase/lipase
VSNSLPPALLLHGDADKDVCIRSRAMVDALRAVGVDADLIAVPRWGHLFEQGGTAQAREAFAAVSSSFGLGLGDLSNHGADQASPTVSADTSLVAPADRRRLPLE